MLVNGCMNSYRINGCSVLGGTSTEILSVVQDCLTQQSSFQPIVTLNVMMFPEYDRDAKLFDWLKESAMFTPDGISMSLSILKQYFTWVSRYPGIDMVSDLLTQSKGYRVAMIGASPAHLNRATDFFKRQYSNHELVFSVDGFCEFTKKHVSQLVISKPDIVLVALGCPKQDIMLKQLADVLPYGVGIGVGGVFDVWAGAVSRAPWAFRRLGLEWLFRLIKEPRRIFGWTKVFKWLMVR